MKIAVTSVSGQLGAAIVQQLKADIGAENVIGIARTVSKAAHLGVEIRKGDYTSREDFETALKGVNVVVILSGNDAPEKRINQHRNILEAAKSNGLQKIVYTSILGDPEKTAFSPIIASNRQTEADIKASGLDWSIGRNGIYIEPDVEYLEHYTKAGKITNCAGIGKCAYTSRAELAIAYAKMAVEKRHNGQTYNLVGEGITQKELAFCLNKTKGTSLIFEDMSVEAYTAERKAELGDFLGTVIAGIYEGIRNGAFDVPSDFERAAGRPHIPILDIIGNLS
ncbi:MAG: NAD(P)H-binding protein [Cytophagales bacterium]|nr:NAD(P)H-binding protein [Cytophagales bacterium]